MSDTPLMLAIHELNTWLDELKELRENLNERDESYQLDREIEVLNGAITVCRKHTDYDKPTESESE